MKDMLHVCDTNLKVNVIKGFRPNAMDSKSVELRFMSVRVEQELS